MIQNYLARHTWRVRAIDVIKAMGGRVLL